MRAAFREGGEPCLPWRGEPGSKQSAAARCTQEAEAGSSRWTWSGLRERVLERRQVCGGGPQAARAWGAASGGAVWTSVYQDHPHPHPKPALAGRVGNGARKLCPKLEALHGAGHSACGDTARGQGPALCQGADSVACSQGRPGP